MKRILFLLVFLPLFGFSQTIKKGSELPEATTINSTDDFLMIQSGTTKRMPYSIFKWYSDDVAGQVSDSLDYYATLDTLAYYPMVSGTQYQIPFLNSAGTGFDFGSNFSWNDTALIVSYGNDNLIINTVDERTAVISGNGVNTIIGAVAGVDITTGSYNSLFGGDAGMSLETGYNNTFLGSGSGANNISGVSNIFLGYNAGASETGSNKLYIENSNSTTPLIYGEFDNDSIVINGSARITGSLDVGGVVSSGMLRQTSTWHLFGGFQDSTTLIDLTEDVFSHVTNAYGTLWTGIEADGFVMSGDTSTFTYAGDYFGSYSVTFTGTAGIVYEFRVYNVTQSTQQGFAVAATGDGVGDFVTVTKPLYFDDIQAGDKLILQVTNLDSSTDITIRYGSYFITYLHE